MNVAASPETTTLEPTPIRVNIPGKDVPQVYWYLRYTVTNNTGRDQIFMPDFVLYTDTGEVRETEAALLPRK